MSITEIQMCECVTNLLRGATNEAVNTPAHVVTEAGVVSCGRRTGAGGVAGLSATLQLREVKRRWNPRRMSLLMQVWILRREVVC